MWKFIIGAVMALLVAVVIAVVVGLKNINELVKVAIEAVGSDVTGSRVTLQEVDISLMDGRGELRGLTLHNPKGFNSDYLFHLNSTVLKIDLESLTKKVIVIEEVTVDGPNVIAEQKDLLKTNLQTMWENIQHNEAGAGQNTQGNAKEDSPHKNIRLMVRQFTFSNAQLDLVTQEWGSRSLNMDTVTADNLGNAKEGLTPEALVKALLKPMIKAARKQAERAIKEKLKDKAEDKAKKKLEEKLEDKLSEKDRAKLDELRSLFKK